MRKFKPTLSIFLSLVLVMAFVPMTASASGTTPIISNSSALDSNGNVWYWYWAEGEDIPGIDSTNWVHRAVQIPNLNNVIGLYGSSALRADGTVWVWTMDYWGGGSLHGPVQVTNLSNIVAISDNAAIRADGTVWDFWFDIVDVIEGVPIVATQITNLSNVSAIGGGYILRPNGTVWTSVWGGDDLVQISNFNNVTAISGMGWGGAALRSDGTVWTWYLSSQRGTFHYVPSPVAGLNNVTAIAGGTTLRADGTVWHFMYSGSGGWVRDRAVQISIGGRATAIARSAALGADGYVWLWGINCGCFARDCEAAITARRLPRPDGRGYLNLGTGAVSAPPTTPTPAPAPVSVILDGAPLAMDVPAQMIDGRTMVPLRAIFEALGADVDWNEATRTITATKDDTTVILTLGSTTPTVNGQTVTIDVPAASVGGRTLVPLRFVAESFGVEVNWDGATRTVTITTD